MITPLVSVIIPHYNRPVLLNRAINSVITQTYENIEIIVVDDNSELGIDKIYHEKVAYLFNNENNGPSFCRYQGFNKSSGNFILFLDSDDYLDKNYIRLCLNEHLKSLYSLVFGKTLIIENEKVIMNRPNTEVNPKISPIYLLYYPKPWSTSSALIKREYIDDSCFQKGLYSYEDYLMFFQILNQNSCIKYIQNALCYYDNSSLNKLSDDKTRVIESRKEIYSIIIKSLRFTKIESFKLLFICFIRKSFISNNFGLNSRVISFLNNFFRPERMQ